MEELGEAIDSDSPMLMFIWRQECVDCPEIIRKLERMIRKYPPLTAYSVLLDEHPTAAARFGIFQPPAVVLYVNRSMTLKQMAQIDLQALQRALDKLYTK